MPDLCEVEIEPGQPCPETATETIRVRDRVTTLTSVIKVCGEHKKDHDRKAARVRMKSKP